VTADGGFATGEPEQTAVRSVPGGPGGQGRARRRLRDAGVILVAAVASALLLRTFVLEALRVPSRSMEPSLLPGDFVIVSKLPFARPGRGEVFAFRFPSGVDSPHAEVVFVKRCIAVPGDSVEVTDGMIRVNGVQADPPGMVASGAGLPPGLAGVHRTWVIPRPGEEIALSDSLLPRWHALIEREGHRVATGPSGDVLLDGTPATSYRVERRHYFVAGDNRTDSFDSRFWGLLPEDAVLGKAILIYWSWDSGLSAVRWGRLGALVR